jgi:hypothetical protein
MHMTAELALRPLNAPLQLDCPKGFLLVSTCVDPNAEAIRMFVVEDAADQVFGTVRQPNWARSQKLRTAKLPWHNGIHAEII